MHIGEVIHRRSSSDLVSDNQKIKYIKPSDTKSDIKYQQAFAVYKSLPFPTDPQYRKLIIWQLMRIGIKRFNECVTKAAAARSPERYLMVCLKNEGACQSAPAGSE